MRRLEFSDFQIDLDTMSLSRGSQPISIGRRTLDTLLFLIQNKSHTVPRDKLHRHIWRSEQIAPSTISMCIREIRKALSDDAASPRFITSSKGRGYRFIGDVRLINDTPPLENSPYEFSFVGRKAAMEALHAAAQATLANLRGKTIAILGEAGVGKSRLVSEFIQQVSNRVDIIVARAASVDSGSPYSVWIQALRTAISRHPKNRQLATCVTRLANFLPELRPVHKRQSIEAKHFNRFSFHLEWAASFCAIVSQRPLILVLEDIHHADHDSLLLLERISSEIANSPIMLIVTTRPSAADRERASTTARILGSTDSTLLQIYPFSLQEVDSILDPFEEDREIIAEEIYRRTAGNAFFVTHLIRLHMRHWRASDADSIQLLFQNGAEIVARQLNDLPSFSQEALTVASIIGPRFSASIVASLLKIPLGEAVDLLVPAERARLVQCDGAEYGFCHAILQELLYWSTDHGLRIRLHSAAAEILETLGSSQSTSVSVFDHLFQAYPIATSTRICTAGLVAGREAISRCAFHEATRVLSRSLTLISQDPATDPTVQCDLMIALGKALLYSGDRERARSTLLDAAALARSMHSPHRLAQCGLDLAPDFLTIEVGTYDPELIMTLREALENLPSEAIGLRSRVIARLSQALQWGGSDSSEQELMASRSVEMAFSSRDQAAIVSALAAVSDALHGPDRVDEKVHRILQLQDASLARSDKYSFLVQQTRLIAALLEKGEVRRISIENDRSRLLADKIGLPQYRWYPVSTDSMLACLSGKFELADQFAAGYEEIAGPNADENFRQTYACQFVLREIERDRSRTILPIVEQFAQSHRSVLSWSAAVAWIQWDCGNEDAARQTLLQFSESDIRRMYREPGGTIGLAALAEVSAYLGEMNRVRFLYDLIAPVSHRFASAGYGVAYFGSLARYSSILAIALRRSPEATKLSQLAVDQESRLHARSWRVLAKLDQMRARSGTLDLRGQSEGGRRLVEMQGTDLPRAKRKIEESLGTYLS